MKTESRHQRRIQILLALVVGLMLTTQTTAQRVQFRKQKGPYYVGEPMIVQVFVREVSSGKQPSCKLRGKVPNGLTIVGPQVGRSVNQVVQMFNGRLTRQETANYRFNFVVTATRSGRYMVGPFVAEIDGKSRTIAAEQLEFEKLQNDPDMEISMTVARPTVYVGEQVPVTIRWAYSGDIDNVRYAFANLQIRSPLFDQFTFNDGRPKTRTTLTLMTAKGEVQLDAEVSKEKRGDREFVVVTGKRIMVVDTEGNFGVTITCRTKKVTRWARDFFGDMVASRTAPSLAAGPTTQLSAKPVPLAGRPDSFSGAVGSGFTIEVAANRSVVRVGDPISLDVTVRGGGSLERLSLPPLSADGGMSDEAFQLPTEKPTGTLSGSAKQFKLNVRVKKQDVKQIPAIAFSWFDPTQKKYLTTRSRPISLQVMPAQIVSAANVVSNSKRVPRQKENGSASGISFVGANLAIEKDKSKLLAAASGRFNLAVVCTLYVLGFVVVVAAAVVRRRQQVDPELILRRNQFKCDRQQIVAAAKMPLRAAAEQVAVALRSVLSRDESVDRRQFDRLTERCDNYTYAPDGEDDQRLTEDLVQEAIRAVDQLAKC